MKNYMKRYFSDKAYRRKLNQFIFRGSFLNFVRSFADNAIIHFLNRSGSCKVTCSVCGWQGAKFESIATMNRYRSAAKCPNCGSLERHRALFELLRERDVISLAHTYLDIAPVSGIARILHQKVKYISLDYGALRADIRGDVQHLPFHANVFDIILCFHVLEFVKNWQKAILEFRNTLKSGGLLILSENFMCGQAATIDFDPGDLTSGSPPRRFGEDFPVSLATLGFTVERIDYLGLYDERGDYFFICSAPES